jgi:putative endonuclease
VNNQRWHTGLAAEEAAAVLLVKAGYTILARRLRTPAGEIDLVARHGDTLAIVEVKARRSRAGGLEAISPRQRQRLTTAAAWLLGAWPEVAACDVRFDCIVAVPGLPLYHVENAWMEGD